MGLILHRNPAVMRAKPLFILFLLFSCAANAAPFCNEAVDNFEVPKAREIRQFFEDFSFTNLGNFKKLGEVKSGNKPGIFTEEYDFPIYATGPELAIVKWGNAIDIGRDYLLLKELNKYGQGIPVYGVAKEGRTYGLIMKYIDRPIETKYIEESSDSLLLNDQVQKDIEETYRVLKRMGVEGIIDPQFLIPRDGSRAYLIWPRIIKRLQHKGPA